MLEVTVKLYTDYKFSVKFPYYFVKKKMDVK